MQLAHDERYHKDVVILPLGERVKHMALHMAKYVGYLAEIEGDDPERVARILTDAFIITLATANALNQDLGRDLGDIADGADLERLGQTFAADLRPANDVSGLLRPAPKDSRRNLEADMLLDRQQAADTTKRVDHR